MAATPWRPIGFIKRRLKLDGGDQRSDDVDDLAAKAAKCLGDALAIRGKPLEEPGRQFLGARVDADDDRIAGSLHRREQTVDEMHESLLRLGLD